MNISLRNIIYEILLPVPVPAARYCSNYVNSPAQKGKYMDTVKDIVIFAPSEAFASAAAELIQERALSNHIGIVEATGNRTLQ